MQWPAANTPVPSIRSFETRILSVGLPASILIACLLGFETLLGPKGSYVALAVLPAAPIGMAIAFLLRYKGSPIRRFVLFLACYLALEWAAEIYYVSYWINHQADPKIPSVADAFWLLSYPVLIVGCWSVAAERRGLRLAVRDAFTHGVWLVAAATSLVWITRALVVSATGTTEAVVLGIYPFADALVISLVLIIRARHNGEPTRLFWSVLLFGNAAVLLGDAGWLLSKTSTQYTDVLS
jgi:hypothetical protein